MKVFKVSCNHGKEKKELPQKLREENISSHLKGLAYKTFFQKKSNIPRDTTGSIIRNFKVYETAAHLPGSCLTSFPSIPSKSKSAREEGTRPLKEP